MIKLNAFQLKIIALIVMLMDHLYFAFPKVFPLCFHPLSRFVALYNAICIKVKIGCCYI